MNAKFLLGWTGFVILFFSGCAADYIEIDRTIPPYYAPKNVFHSAGGVQNLPRRVLILPCYGSAQMSSLKELTEILVEEAGKLRAFEVVTAPPEKVANVFRHQELSLTEAKAWAEQAGADGILTCRVQTIQTIRPLSLGVNMSLWNNSKDSVVWSVDETLDSQLTIVANGARNYYLTKLRVNYPNRRSEHILDSPHLFFKYAISELLSTIP